MDIVRRLTDKLAVFHLHDIRPTDFRDHRAPGRGVIDFARLFEYLHHTNFAGPMVFELEEPDISPALAESKAFIEKLL